MLTAQFTPSAPFLRISAVRLAPAGFRTGREPSVLDAVRATDVTLTAWERSLPAELPAVLQAWADQQPADFGYQGPPGRVNLADATRTFPEPMRTWITQDLEALLQRFVDVTGTDMVRLAFNVERTDKCRKFHVDHLRFRMITTYLGPGTEWVPGDAVNREAMGHPTDCPCDANKDIVRDASAVRHAHAGDVLIMRGTQNSREEGAVHRSPTIAEAGLTRVVLTVTAIG
jgi:hypothetical protein